MTKSLCANVCEYIEGTMVCRGCGRNGEEITEWFTATDDRKKQIAKTARARRKELRIQGYDC